MKKLTLLIFCFLVAINLSHAQNDNDEIVKLSEPVEKGENYEVYGSEFPDDAQYFALGYLIRNSNIFKGQEIATKGTIKQVCQKKGCFFILEDGENEARVTFKDYQFFIPTDAAGAHAELVGIFRVKERSEEQAKHYAEDAGKNSTDIKGAGMEFNIVASSVKITDQ